ncbi:MAG TPA: Fur family transcriptional regulator [Candidatus Saccharimonadales bacterium]|nr:Fur family transcriptional regulator [Candidatus Saccharimonadales bacterium]
MDSSQSQLQKHLKQRGQSLTKPRRAVFLALRGHEPQTMQQLVAACTSIDRATVYRTVALFEQLGIVQRLQIGWKYKLELSDTFSHHHHHMTCLRCGRVISFDETAGLEHELRQITRIKNFQMQSHQLEIQGLCARCAGLQRLA